MKTTHALLLLLGASAVLHGQDAAAPSATAAMPPGPPVQLRATGPSQWVVKMSQGAATAATPTSPPPAGTVDGGKAERPFFGSQVTMTKTGQIMLCQTQDDQGRAWNTWCVNNLQITVYPDGKTTTVQSVPALISFADLFHQDYSPSDFPGFDWVSAQNYAGMRTEQGKQCLYFKEQTNMFAPESPPTEIEAYVDLKTRLPVTLKLAGTARLYTYSISAPSQLSLPEVVQIVLDQRTKSASIAAHKAPPQP